MAGPQNRPNESTRVAREPSFGLFGAGLSTLRLAPEGSVTKKITKAEAVVRSLVISAMKGDSRSQQNLFRLAEQIGQFVEPPAPLQRIERVIVDPRDMGRDLVAIGADEP